MSGCLPQAQADTRSAPRREPDHRRGLSRAQAFGLTGYVDDNGDSFIEQLAAVRMSCRGRRIAQNIANGHACVAQAFRVAMDMARPLRHAPGLIPVELFVAVVLENDDSDAVPIWEQVALYRRALAVAGGVRNAGRVPKIRKDGNGDAAPISHIVTDRDLFPTGVVREISVEECGTAAALNV
jgi:hypothetical protein